MKLLLYGLIIAFIIIIFIVCKQKNIFKATQQADDAENIILNLSSEDLEILPAINSVSNAKNQVWVGTFQLVWNDLINELLKAPVEFVNYKSITAENLNKQAFTEEELSQSSYYKKWGEAVPALKAEMKRAIKKKFNETSDILDQIEWNSTPQLRKYVLYAMLKKEFEFLEKFEKLGKDEFKGSSKLINYFGMEENAAYKLRSTVEVLFYDNAQNFAVVLNTKQGDKVYVYRNDENKTLDVLYNDMLNKSKTYEGERILSKKDTLKVPLMDYKTDREFSEFYDKEIKATDLVITKAIETIEFKMNETGVKLKSEAVIVMGKGIAVSPNRQSPRYFNADGPFVMFIEENGKKPYFAMKVRDAAKLQQQ